MTNPGIEKIIEHLMRRRSAGRFVLLSPHTAGIVEAVLPNHTAAPGVPAAKDTASEGLPYRIDEWSPDGGRILRTIAYLDDFGAALAAFKLYRAAQPHDASPRRAGACRTAVVGQTGRALKRKKSPPAFRPTGSSSNLAWEGAGQDIRLI